MKPLESASVAAPGFFGLNTQESSVTLQAGFALEANNCVIDKRGRLASRKGWRLLTESQTGVDLKGAHEFLDIDGTRTIISWNDDTFYTGTTTFATPTDNSTAFASANFDASTLNDKAYFVQSGDEPRYYDPVGNTFEDISTAGNTTTNLTAIDGANVSLSAYGRLWLADTDNSKTTVYWSDLLDGTNFDSGSAGSIDLSSILVKGNDEIVALGAHVGRLIVFCKRNIVIFQDTDADTVLDPTTMRLAEVIRGHGCICRDSLQNTGDDILFLSSVGLKSLGRLIQEKSQPLRNLSKNVRDDLVGLLQESTPSLIRSVYDPFNSFYLLLFPEYDTIYCFDTRQQLEDGTLRVTTWDTQVHNNLLFSDSVLYFCGADGLSDYYGYQDDGESYRLSYYTNYFDFGDATRIKYLKRVGTTIIGGSGQEVVIKAGYDYEDNYVTFPVILETGGSVAEFGISEYNEAAEYTTGLLVDKARAPIGGSGEVLQIGLEAQVDSSEISIQKLDIYIKQGRVY